MKNRFWFVNTLLILLTLVTALIPSPALAKPKHKERPQIVLRHYGSNEGPLTYGLEFNLVMKLKNDSTSTAMRTQITFSSTDVSPRKTGGVIFAGNIDGLKLITVSQPMVVIGYLVGRKYANVDMNLLYYDDAGTPYTEKFTLLLEAGPNTVTYKTATPTPFKRSQLIITDYKTNIQNLQPGTMFNLDMTVQNVGNAAAKAVTMIVGGGSTSSNDGGTPVAGGVSGGSGEFTNFAPVGTSNIQSLGDFAVGASLDASQKLIVNVSTNPGAYPMKVTFSYIDEAGNVINDEQVITLLVYSLPTVDVSFYQPVTALMAGQPNMLPLQVVNLGKRASVLGSMTVETSSGMIENATGLVGSLEPGGYFTLDSMVYPEQAGPMELTITINYTDDFNEARTIVKTLTLDVMEAPLEPTFDPNMPGGGGGGMYPEGEMPPAAEEESWTDQLWRFVLGLFGLDSGSPNQNEIPTPPIEEPAPATGGKG